MVDLPLPLSPTIAVEVPGSTVKETSLRICRRESYVKPTLVKEMRPTQLSLGVASGLSLTSASFLNCIHS